MVQFIKSKPTTFRNKPVGVVAADTGAIQLGNAVSELGNSMQKIFWEEARQDAIKSDVERAKTLAVADQGKIIFEKANFTQVGTPYAEKILAQRYSDAVGLQSKSEFAKLQAENRYDKETFDTQANGYIEAKIKSFKDNGMEKYIPDFITKITNQKVLHSNKILNDTIGRDERVAAQNLLLTTKDNINALQTLTYNKQNFQFSEVEGPESEKQMNVDIDNTVTDIKESINSLVAEGHIKAPAAADMMSELRRNQAYGVVNNIVDKLGEDASAIKAIEQLFQSKNVSPQLENYLMRATKGKINRDDLLKIYRLKNELNLTKTDMSVISREISNRSGDASKLLEGMEKEYASINFANLLKGGSGNKLLNNDKDTRKGINDGIDYNSNELITSISFFSLPAAKYSDVVKQISNVDVLPTFAHDIFKADNILNSSAFANQSPAVKKNVAARTLDMWKNVAYTNTGASRLQGYDDEYFKFSLIDAAASVNGNDLVGIFDYFSRPNTTKKELDNSVMTSFAKFYPDSKATTIKGALNEILTDAKIPRHSWNLMTPYANKLMVFKNAKNDQGKVVEFTKESMQTVLQETYENMFVEDETVYDYFAKDLTTNTQYTPKRKYTGITYDKFKVHVNNIISETTKGYDSLGEDVFLLPDVRNTQFGDQRYTLVDKDGIVILNAEGVETTFNTKEFDKSLKNQSIEENKITLSNALKLRAEDMGATIPPSLFNANIEDINFTDFISPNDLDLGYTSTFQSIKELDAPVLAGDFVGRDAVETFKSEDQKEFESVTKFGTAEDTKKVGETLKVFKNYVDGLEPNYLENKISEKGYQNPSWKYIQESIITKNSITDKLRSLYTELTTPDVAVEIQNDLIDVVKFTAGKEGFRTRTYRDASTLSIGRGFNVRYLTENDYSFIPKDLGAELKVLQKDLLANKNLTKEQLVRKSNDFQRLLESKGIRGLLQQTADKIYTSKMKDIYQKYTKEFPMFSTLSGERQSAIIDFSYQLGHENVKGKFPKYYQAISNALNSDDIDVRDYYFRQAGFHQTYNVGQYGNTKTLIHNQTRGRVRERTAMLGFNIRDIDFLDEDMS